MRILACFLRYPLSGIELPTLVLCVGILTVSGPCQQLPAHQPEPSYLQITSQTFPLNDKRIPTAVRSALGTSAALSWTDQQGTQWQATSRGLLEKKLNAPTGRASTVTDGLPFLNLTGISGDKDGKLWLATAQGAVLYKPDAPVEARAYFFSGQRYLHDDHVLQIVAERGRAWIRTETAISRIDFVPYRLEEKGRLFLARIQKRHNRYGYVASCQILRAGDTSSFRMIPDDNDGLWTSMYVAAESFRYASTHSPSALQNARKSLAALLRLVSITSIQGLPARSLMHKGDYREPDGEWHWTADGEWEWKGDTSSDELVGHFFAYWVAYNLLPDDGDRARIRAAVSSIANGLIDHDLRLIGYGGHVTTWGRYGPEYLKTVDRDEKALDSLEVLSHLAVAYQITGESKFLEASRRIGIKLGYVANITHFADDTAPEINYSDEELAFLSFYPLMNAERDEGLRRQYQQGLTQLWKRARSEKNPLWNMIYAQSAGAGVSNCADALDSLQRIPLSTISWNAVNSHRDDVAVKPQPDRNQELEAQSVIAPNERRTMKWNGNPFVPDGGDSGKSEDDGTFFLLPYWLGRYHHLIPCRP